MLSSSPVEKFKNANKKSKKKYQPFNFNQESEKTSSFEKLDNMNVAWNKGSVGKSFNGFMDSRDFPELKVSQKHYKKTINESSNDEIKWSNSCLPAVNRNAKKSLESFPVLPIPKNCKTAKMTLMEEKECPLVHDSEKNNFDLSKTNREITVGKEMDANVNLSKKSQGKTIIKGSVQNQKNFHKKKRADPVCINFQDILDKNKIRKMKNKKNGFKTKQRFRHEEVLSGNLLDSSNPIRRRGKYREIKKKKLTSFKTVILKERLLKQKMRELASSTDLESEYFNLISKIDFNTEIKSYLNELNERKVKNSVGNMSIMKDKKLENNTQDEKNIGTKLTVKKEENSGKVSGFTKKEIPLITLEGEIKFSSKFREYCDNIITANLNSAVSELIKELIKLQDKLFLRDPVKAKIRKRHVSGIKEVKKYLILKKVKMVIIAPNLEKLQMKGGIYDVVNELKSMANSQNVPYGFALNRYNLGICAKKNVPISAFAVLNYEGAESFYTTALDHLNEAKKKFAELRTPKKIAEMTEDNNSQIISSLISAFREDLQIYGKAGSD